MLDDLPLPAELECRSLRFILRNATDADLDILLQLLADDAISAARGDVAAPADRPIYRAAQQRITEDSSNALIVVADDTATVLGIMQLTRIPGLARRGSNRLLVEAVRVARDRRSTGIGSAMVRWVTEVAAPTLDVGLVQLTSDARRTDAHRFYERLGFTGSHIGFKYRVR